MEKNIFNISGVDSNNAKWLMPSLTIYRQITEDPVMILLSELLDAIAANPVSDTDIIKKYHTFCASALLKDWPRYLIDLILKDTNVYTRLATAKNQDHRQNIQLAAARDLAIFQTLTSLSAKKIKKWIQDQTNLNIEYEEKGQSPFLIDNWPEWPELDQSKNMTSIHNDWLTKQRDFIANELRQSPYWSDQIALIAKFHEQAGTGIYAEYLAFRYESTSVGWHLQGIEKPDPVRLEQLIGLEKEHKIILENTEHFLAGYPAQNVLLYGSRGTGKSSTVKALLHLYEDRKLRLIELPKTQLADLPDLIKELSSVPQKFILFIDDLSFDEVDQNYKTLKTILEGGIAAQPDNVLIYATSNRRHLVKETFQDRQGDEVFQHDSMDEKLSLGDRFGITVVFAAPDQEMYLQIVTELARQRGIAAKESELRQQAIHWELWHNGRSGRSAKQFIDYMTAKQELKKK